MTVDVNTLFLVTVYVEAILGLLLLFAWVQNIAVLAAAWWGGAHLLRAGSLALYGMHGSAPDWITLDLANAILFISFAATWTGARVLDGRAPHLVGLLAGAVIWLIVSRIPLVAQSVEWRALIATVIITSYIWLAGFEFWCGRADPLVSRLPAVFMLLAHGLLFLLRTPLALVLPWPPANSAFTSVWLTVLSFEELLFTIAVAFIMLAMTKERTEQGHRNAALADPLTGVSNRRGFLVESDELARQQAEKPQPAAVLLLDLDHFKSINDRFGHAIGDRVLQVFAQTAAANLRTTDLLGRLGGEEFAVLLCNVGRERALVAAERIRSTFAEVALEVDGRPVSATVSVGVALCDGKKVDVPGLLVQADQALYRAKERGRNRVEIAGADRPLRRTDDAQALFSGLAPSSAAA
jgi:diguanylate cyclase (GGDEF)-like protein